ncbi:MAG TPA: L-serine ammonia-lyase, iron-sulfur-dependent, subunit alpha [Candidatus Cryptobacteroides excrementigallinarum]|nr:L-serine ammonia-lyase, iron-sulfur-dependent, subunit alpha [Candidatus Cryptobacteroides excrementigallinarum]
MKSLKELYKIGRGPSSSHTMGPNKAAAMFARRHPEADAFEVTLYGSLAATGRGHLTDLAVSDPLSDGGRRRVDIIWKPEVFLPFHPNGMKFTAKDADGNVGDEWTVYSIGGGTISEGPGSAIGEGPDIYGLNSIHEIVRWCNDTGRNYWEYVQECEDSDFWDYMKTVWEAMKASVERGINTEGALPGPLRLSRKAAMYHIKVSGYRANLQTRGMVFSYALAVSEENASGGVVVTAPTCGSSGVMPAVLYHISKGHNFTETRILHALATGGLFGNVVKQNASISGAEVGCQGEVGVACAMAAAATCQLFGGTPTQVEYAAEMGLEHHLGMTCDPVCGLVQIPCIERNAFAAARALDANLYASFSDGNHRVSFDEVVQVMKDTGHDLPSLYKETGEGGLAVGYKTRLAKQKVFTE